MKDGRGRGGGREEKRKGGTREKGGEEGEKGRRGKSERLTREKKGRREGVNEGRGREKRKEGKGLRSEKGGGEGDEGRRGEGLRRGGRGDYSVWLPLIGLIQVAAHVLASVGSAMLINSACNYLSGCNIRNWASSCILA